jgi:arsenite methyltransferase
MNPTPVADDLDARIEEKYGRAALQVALGQAATGACCATGGGCDPITANLYQEGEVVGLPDGAVRASLGCGNPTLLAQLEPGQTVLDLGSGGGLDVLLSARRVGAAGKAYGLDRTDEMLALARENQRQAGATNVEFLKGRIEEIPLPEASVDVVISNCVVNLSGDKRQVFAETFRVLRPGGRLAISDVVVRGAVPEEIRRHMELWIGCVAGALEESELRGILTDVGFADIEVEPTRIYAADDARAFLADSGLDAGAFAEQIEGRFLAAFIRGRKPA